MTNPIPDGYNSITPYLVVDDAEGAIEFYTRAFGATEIFRLPMPAPGGAGGAHKIGHAEIKVGDSVVMLADEFPEMNIRGPKSRGGPTSSLLLYSADVDSAFARAIEAGCTSERDPENQFWGDRMGTLVDPYGHRWSIATHVEEVSPEEMQRRMAEFSSGQKQGEMA